MRLIQITTAKKRNFDVSLTKAGLMTLTKNFIDDNKLTNKNIGFFLDDEDKDYKFLYLTEIDNGSKLRKLSSSSYATNIAGLADKVVKEKPTRYKLIKRKNHEEKLYFVLERI